MPRDLLVPLDDVQLRVRQWSGPASAVPVVLLPATGATAEDWDVVAAALQSTRAVHAVDLRGHGRSDWPGTYSIETMADDVGLLLGRLAADGPLDVIGHSLGGLVACRAAAAVPSLVRRVVLEDVGVPHPRTPAPPARPPGELSFDWRVVEQVRPQIDDPSPDWPAVLASVRAPLLVLAGGASSPVPAEHVRELVELVASGQVVTLQTGHFVHESAPEAFVREVQDFLDR